MEQKHPAIDGIPWDQPATMIDLDGKPPLIGTIRDCAVHFGLYKDHAKAQARVLLTQPVHREGRKTRTWLLEPDEIDALAERLKREPTECQATRSAHQCANRSP